jgi:hypothetical protein
MASNRSPGHSTVAKDSSPTSTGTAGKGDCGDYSDYSDEDLLSLNIFIARPRRNCATAEFSHNLSTTAGQQGGRSISGQESKLNSNRAMTALTVTPGGSLGERAIYIDPAMHSLQGAVTHDTR